jgi:hypothetical protein
MCQIILEYRSNFDVVVCLFIYVYLCTLPECWLVLVEVLSFIFLRNPYRLTVFIISTTSLV